MPLQAIDLGQVANDGTGDPLREAFDKINDNFGELYGLLSQTISAATYPGATSAISVQAAIDVAVAAGKQFVYVPASMLPYDASAVTFNATVRMVWEGGDWSVYDVDAYGAGNGVDDTVAIQAALTAATGSATVLVNARTYLITAALNYASGVLIRGHGANSIIQNKTTRNVNSAIMLQPTTTGHSNVTIRDLVLDQRSDVLGDSGSSNCLSINGIAGCTIENVIFRHIITMAVWADSIASLGVSTTGVSITGCRVEDSLGGGVSVFGACYGWTVSHNRFTDCRDDAIAFQDRTTGELPHDLEVSGNIVRNCDRRNTFGSTPRGILFFGCYDFSAVGNVVNKTACSGIAVETGQSGTASRDGLIAGNVIDQAGVTVDSTAGVPGHGIHVLDGVNITLNGNKIKGSREDGMKVYGVSEIITVIGNTCRGNGSSGCQLSDVRDFTVTGNSFNDNGTNPGSAAPYGLLLTSTARSVTEGKVTGNSFTRSLLTLSGFQQNYGVYITTASGFVATEVEFVNNDLRRNAFGTFGGVAGTNITKRANRYRSGPMEGQATLTNGTVTITTAEVDSGCTFWLCRIGGAGTTRGILGVGTITDGVSFVVDSRDLAAVLSADDDSTFSWGLDH